MLASETGRTTLLILVPVALLAFGVSLAVVLAMSRWILDRVGTKGALVIVLLVWPLAVVAYALLLDPSDRHYDKRWVFGTLQAGMMLGATFAGILCAGHVTSPDRWSRLMEDWSHNRERGFDTRTAILRYVFGSAPALFVVASLIALAILDIILR